MVGDTKWKVPSASFRIKLNFKTNIVRRHELDFEWLADTKWKVPSAQYYVEKKKRLKYSVSYDKIN